ncbi:MAG: ferredoxin [Thermoplasmatales archaeon]|nr:ferredoxin [Thermoplasmatales archaeon]
MKVSVIESDCIGCGRCEEECPEIFELDNDLISRIRRQPREDEEDCVVNVEKICPGAAIVISE